MTGNLNALICGGVGIFKWLLELKVDHGPLWTKQKVFKDVKRLRHLIYQHQLWWLRIAHKMQEPRSPREIAAVNIRTLPSPGSRDQPGRWACKCSTLMSPKTKDQMASPTFYPTSRPPNIFFFLQGNVQGVPKKSCEQNATGAWKFPKIRGLLNWSPTTPLHFCPKSRIHALALGHLTSSEKTIRRHHSQLTHHPHFTSIHPYIETPLHQGQLRSVVGNSPTMGGNPTTG